MTTQTPSPSSMGSRNIDESTIQVNVQAATLDTIKAVLLADGWHNVSNCQIVHFAFGEANSPITPDSLYKYLTYQEAGRIIYTPMRAIQGFDLTGIVR